MNNTLTDTPNGTRPALFTQGNESQLAYYLDSEYGISDCHVCMESSLCGVTVVSSAVAHTHVIISYLFQILRSLACWTASRPKASIV